MLAGFLIGCFVGSLLGVFVSCLLVAGKGHLVPLVIPEESEAVRRRGPQAEWDSCEYDFLFSEPRRRVRRMLREVLEELTLTLQGPPAGVWIGSLHQLELEGQLKLANLLPGSLIERVYGVPFYWDPVVPKDRIRVLLDGEEKEIVLNPEVLPQQVTALAVQRA